MTDDLDALLAQAVAHVAALARDTQPWWDDEHCLDNGQSINVINNLAAAVRTLRTERDTALDVIGQRLLINDEDKRYPFHDGDDGWWWMDNPDWDSRAEQATDVERVVLAAAETRHKDPT